jgi:hypothetical protein
MLRSVLIAAMLWLAVATPALAQAGGDFCQNRCMRYCARKELAPGLYRSECDTACQRGCYRRIAEHELNPNAPQKPHSPHRHSKSNGRGLTTSNNPER